MLFKRQKELEKELESQYGKIITKSFCQYWGGYRRQIEGGLLSPASMGMMYLFKKFFLFRSDVVRNRNYWEIVIPINSIITENWNPKKHEEKESTLGVRVFEEKGFGKKRFVVPFIDDSGIKHEPIFTVIGNFAPKKAVGVSSWWGGGGFTKWMQQFYDVILENKKQITEATEVKYEIEKWIEEWEGQTLEFKREDILNDSFKLARSMVAFANNKSVSGDVGGRIVIGVNNQTHVIEGIKSKAGHEEYIMNIARDRCLPPLTPDFEKINHKGKTLYIISIPKMKRTPFQLKAKEGNIHLIRVGSTIRNPSAEEIAELYGKSKSEEEKSREIQLIQNLIENLRSLKEKMVYLKGIAKNRELLIAQFKEHVDKKNKLIDDTKDLLTNPLVVFDDKLKREILQTLQICRFKPAWEALDPFLKMQRERKMLENGWSRESIDFNVKNRFVDNNTDEAIVEVTNTLQKLESLKIE